MNLRPAAALLLLGALLVSACGTDGGTASAGDRPVRVAASMTVIADFAREVGGDRVEVVSLVPVGGDPHVYEPRPSDARTLAEADLVLANGLGLEPWLETLARGAENDVLTLGTHLGEAVVHEAGGEPDPHLWMVPPFAARYATAIAAALSDLDPAHADRYAANAARYSDELDTLDTEIADTLAAIPPDRRLLMTSHDAYTYFSAHYGLEVLGTVVGVSTEEEPSARRVRELVDAVRAADVPTIYVETTVNPSVVERIARDAGVRVGDPLYGDSLGEPGSGAETYADMLRANAAALVDGLAP